MTFRLASSVLLTIVLALGCAEGGSDSDGGANDGDGGASDGGTNDSGPRDAGGAECGAGEHRCGGGCIDDLDNTPENGCRFGCGEPCETPPDGAADCDEAGECTFACPPPFTRDGTTCVCMARTCEDIGYMCGAPDDGCGVTLDCGTCPGDGVCTDGVCACTEDDREPNESRLEAPSVASLSDSPASEVTYMLTIHDASDEDWLSFEVADNSDCCSSTNPDITVTLDQIPMGSNYDLAAYYVCGDSSSHDTSCDSGAPDSTIGAGCRATSSGTTLERVILRSDCGGTTDETGTLFVRVTAPTFGGSCAPYRLHISVD